MGDLLLSRRLEVSKIIPNVAVTLSVADQEFMIAAVREKEARDAVAIELQNATSVKKVARKSPVVQFFSRSDYVLCALVVVVVSL